MKKFSKTVVVILVLLILLTAYWAWEGRLPDLASLRKAQQETKIAGQNGETLSLQESRPDGASGGQNAGTMQETAEPEPRETQENGTAQTAEGVRPAQPAETGYAYSLLDEEEKSLYLQMLQSITGFSQETELTTLKPELLEPVFNSVLADHPEIFYVDGYTYTKHTLGEEIHKITFTARNTLTQAEAEQRKKGIEANIETALSGIHSGMDDYQKIKYIYDYMIEHTDYRLDSPENQTVCSVFLYGESVCQGYAKAFQLLCSRVGIPAVLVTGEVKNGEAHAWDLVQSDGEWYYADPTWGDAFYLMGDDDPAWQGKKRPSVNYDYLLVTTQQLLRTHTIDNFFPLPDCTAMKDNYYVRENAYFDTVDEDKLARLFARGYEEQKGMVTLKCADADIYLQMKQKLLDDQEIFTYLKNGGSSAAYVDTPEQYTLSFWLE